MKQQRDHLETLSDIRSMMEQSTRFISLSGLSGIVIGCIALAGVAAAYLRLGSIWGLAAPSGEYTRVSPATEDLLFFIGDGLLVLALSVIVSTVFTIRKARKEGQSVWNPAARRLMVNMLIPLMAGGLFTLILIFHGIWFLLVPATLIFYGLALINASKYTLGEVRYLGLLQVTLGLVASLFPSYGLLFWGAGFGLLHIIYGIVMYSRYQG